MLKKNQINTGKKPAMDNPGTEFFSSEPIFDLQEIETIFLKERRQIQDYNFYYHLSIAGFYISLLLFVWHIVDG